MNESKQRSELHLIDAEGEGLLRSCLPRHWVLRDYRPDYGLDFALEVIRPTEFAGKEHATYQTLGEHVFMQLKSMSSASPLPLKLYERVNVEKQTEVLDNDSFVGELETIRFSVETSELVTVERMGVGVPVILVIADLSRSKCYFVCLNDYINKILIPRRGDYKTKASRTIHVPTTNDVGDAQIGQVALRWYGKRPKLYSAFQRFVFQAAELDYSRDGSELLGMARYFATRIASYDFWDDTEMWAPIGFFGLAIKRFLAGGQSGLMSWDSTAILEAADGDEEKIKQIKDWLSDEDVLGLWRHLALLSRNYEDVCREWYLPTSLGYRASY